MSGFVLFLLAIAMLLTLAVLFTGLFAMVRGGEFNRKYGNRLMQARVAVQGVAIGLFVLAFLIGRG